MMRWKSAALLLVAGLALPAAARARGTGGEFEERRSSHFVLRQDAVTGERGGFYGSRRFEAQLLDELERAYGELEHWLALRPQQRIEVIVYDPARFDADFAGLTRFRAAGFYHGVIRVRGDTQLTEAVSRVLHHELVHAALDAAAPTLALPGWVNEGTAEWFEARTQGNRGLGLHESAALAELAQRGELFGLSALATPTFAGFSAPAAQVAYLESYALIDFLARQRGERSLADFLSALIRSRSLDRALRRVYQFDAQTLETKFVQELS
jgi:hypothetical protein